MTEQTTISSRPSSGSSRSSRNPLARPLQPPTSLPTNSSFQHTSYNRPPRPLPLPTTNPRLNPLSNLLHRPSKLLLPSPLFPPNSLLLPQRSRRSPYPQTPRRRTPAGGHPTKSLLRRTNPNPRRRRGTTKTSRSPSIRQTVFHLAATQPAARMGDAT